MNVRRRLLAERFWGKVEKRGPDECWPWLGAKSQRGYGQIGSGGRCGKTVQATRVSWEIHNGPIADGEGCHGTCICHKCDNPACVNPAHLFVGTQKDNLADMARKGRSTHGSRNPRAILNEAAVVEIRRRRDAGEPAARIAGDYGVSKWAIHKLRRQGAWRHAK